MTGWDTPTPKHQIGSVGDGDTLVGINEEVALAGLCERRENIQQVLATVRDGGALEPNYPPGYFRGIADGLLIDRPTMKFETEQTLAIRQEIDTLLRELDSLLEENAAHKRNRSALDRLERQRQAIRERAERGAFMGGAPPYGYRWDEATQRWEPVEAELRVLLEMRRLRAQGLGVRRIAAELNRQGIPTPKGGETWRPSSVDRILKNPFYARMANGTPA